LAGLALWLFAFADVDFMMEAVDAFPCRIAAMTGGWTGLSRSSVQSVGEAPIHAARRLSGFAANTLERWGINPHFYGSQLITRIPAT